MSQTNEYPTVKVNPVASDIEEKGETVVTILEQVNKLFGGSDSTDTTNSGTQAPVQQQPQAPVINWGSIAKYGMYGGAAIAAVYLMGKALE